MKWLIFILALFVGHISSEEKWSWGAGEDGTDTVASVKILFKDSTGRGQSEQRPLVFHPAEEEKVEKAPIVTSRQSRKIEAELSESRKGKTEPRFSGLKKQLCKYGMAVNCPDGYDLLEYEEQPYALASSYPTSHYGAPPQLQYGSSNHYGGGGGGGIDPNQVLAVQPVALQPVGSPIQAVPIGPGGNAVGGGLGGVGVSPGSFSTGGVGSYSPGGIGIGTSGYPAPGGVYSSPGIPSSGYGVPHAPPAYGSAYSPPSHSSGVIHSPPVASFEPTTSFEEIPHKKEVLIETEPQVVKHYHTHTHVYKGSGSGERPIVGDFFGGTSISSSLNSRPHRSHRLPVVKPVLQSINSYYREDCQCVPNYFCPPSDVVGRTNSLPQLDARNNPLKILSTAADNEGLQGSATQKREVKIEAPTTQTKNKSKREIRTTFKLFNDTNKLNGRQVHGTYRIRNVSSRSSSCQSGEVCCRNPEFTARHLSYSCGKKNSAGVLGRVRNARYEKHEGDTEFGEYPWQAAILKRESKEVIYVCGAALVNDRHVLTAAHCVNGMSPNELKIRLGEWDVNRKTEFYDHVEKSVEKIIIHPHFYSGTLTNDVAILALRTPVDFNSSPHINPVCLPHSKSDFTNRHCLVSGWGKDAFGNEGDFQFILKEVEVPIWGKNGCQTALRKTRLGQSYSLDEGMLCAGGEEGKDACKGDGGGPLVCSGNDGSMELAGLVSWGIGCGERGIPGVYVNVPHFVDWITENMMIQ